MQFVSKSVQFPSFLTYSVELFRIDDADGTDDYSDDLSVDTGTNQKQQSNQVDLNEPKAYFKLSDYKEMAQVGETVTLKCEVGNVSRKFPLVNLSIKWFVPFVSCNSFFFFFVYSTNDVCVVQKQFSNYAFASKASYCHR